MWGIRLGGLGPFFYVPAKMRHARRLFAKFSQFSPGQIERGSARDKVLRNTNKSWNALNRVFGCATVLSLMDLRPLVVTQPFMGLTSGTPAVKEHAG